MNFPRLALRLLGKRLPKLDGTIEVPGLIGEIVIRRDRFGVPHIETSVDDDAWFGLGFCQGQDRAFQLETRLRVVRGTVAALLGPDLLPIDRLSRRIGFRRHGDRGLELLEPQHLAAFEAFAAGVRAGMDAGGGGRSHEFVLLRTKPTPFEAADALGFLAVQSFALASNWDVELARLRMLATDGPDAVADLHPPYAQDHPVSERPGERAVEVVDALAADLKAAGELFVPGGGSNNWAIAAERTTGGLPILANDPHLAPTLPPHWYLAHVTAPGWGATGGVIPGTPIFGVGHNGIGAWGVTAGLIDNTDLFVEEVGPDGRSVRRGNDFVPCDVRTETIEVKGSDPEVIEVLETDRGPVVGPAFEGDFGALSMSATWLRPAPLGKGLDVGTIGSFDELTETYAEWPSISVNVAYAGPDGIGWKLIGEAPRRTGGGTIPVSAADPATRWSDDPISSRELPSALNPDAGFVATANNLPSTDLYLGSDFLDGYRVSRISELLAASSDWDVDAVMQMQRDQQSIPWREMRETVLDAAAPAGDLGTVANLLRDWDGRVSPDSPAATVFEVFVATLSRRVAEARAPRSARYALGEGFTPLVPFTGLIVRRVSHLIDLMQRRPDGWFEEGWEEEMRAALREAAETITGAAGPQQRDWAWGKVRELHLKHPLGMQRPLDRVYDLGPISIGGDANTINPAPVDPRDPLANPNFAIASLRFVVEVGDWDRARFVLPGGQSGNPFSPHYADQLPLWSRGDAMTVPWSTAQVERQARHALRLSPG